MRATWWALVAVTFVLGGCGSGGAAAGSSSVGRPVAGSSAVALPAVSPVGSRGAPTAVQPGITYPAVGPGTFDYATVGGPVAGTTGRLLRYRIAVEQGIAGIGADAFADQVGTVLADPRSWTGTGQWRLQRAEPGAHFDFTIYLATPATRDKLCMSGYDRYTSCRKENSVVVNVARWAHGVPSFNGDLAAYREYVVNHETGHRLGHGHELCTGAGRAAPVMQQQTLGLHGCVPNAWPIVDGRAYAGRSGQYVDPTPKDS